MGNDELTEAGQGKATDQPNVARPTQCSCGARLVADALFCHRCGKPVFDEPRAEAPPDATPVIPDLAISQSAREDRASGDTVSSHLTGSLPINLRNKLAVQIAFFIAVFEFPLITFSGLLPVNPLVISAIVLALGGYFAVHLYQRRTHDTLGMMNGFRLGWISGLFLFVLVLIFGAIQFAFFTFSGGSLVGQLDQMIAVSGGNAMPPEQQQLMREVFSDGSKLFVMVLLALLLLFLYLTACAGVGGAIGARARMAQPRSG
ncbi:MAG: DUF4199 domain-containing protein [Bryobacterales bacterium]|nr:DUF4199 domain-containing protein [Bryobacterales bacterium]